jgi:hypothetical protein
VAGDLTTTSGFNSGREGMAAWERGSAGEGEWIGNKWTTGEGSRGGLGFYIAGWAWSRVHLRWMPLGVVGGSLGRRRALSAGNRWAVSVARWFG